MFISSLALIGFYAITAAHTTPMLTINIDRCRKVKHQFARITTVGLQFVWLFMAANGDTYTVGKQTFSTVANEVLVIVASNSLTELIVMSRDIAIRIGTNDKYSETTAA